jgi:uncharacterized membrane protein (UPF0127 family)
MHHRSTTAEFSQEPAGMKHRLLQSASGRNRHARSVLLALLLAPLALAATMPARAMDVEKLETFPRTNLQIRTRDSAEWFNAWVDDTPAREQQGLMFLHWLAPDQGMLFPQDPPRVMSMWMKNTLIPLDMLFIDARGRIVYIKADATPQSEAIITDPTPVRAVLELAGGEAARRNIRVGDTVRHALFGSAPAGPVRQ